MAHRSTAASAEPAEAAVPARRSGIAHEVVLNGLRGLVLSGELPPGSPIRQDDVAERFGVSRVPVREALKILEGEGHVTYVAHHGFRVNLLSITELAEIYAMREWIETGLVRASVPLLGRAELRAAETSMTAMSAAAAAGDVAAVNRHNRRFHFQLFEPSGLRRAVRTVGQLWDATDPYRALYFEAHFDADTINTDHGEIVDAAFGHDVERTVRLLNLHRGDALARLRARMTEVT